MLYYVETATAKRAYADQETTAWDREKGELRTVKNTDAKAELASHAFEKFDAQQAKTVTEKLVAPTYSCEWDGLAPYVTTISGTFPKDGIPIMGWPQTDVPPAVQIEEFSSLPVDGQFPGPPGP
jgi:hypothetical protein